MLSKTLLEHDISRALFFKILTNFQFFSELLRLHMNQRPPFQFQGQPSLPRITSIKFRHLSSRPINSSSSLNSSLRDNILRYVFKSLLVFICLHQHDFSCEGSLLGIQNQLQIFVSKCPGLKEILILFEMEESGADKNCSKI